MITPDNKEFIASFGSIDQLDKLIDDPAVSKSSMIENPNIQDRHINKLVNDPAWVVRSNIARHPKLSSENVNTLIKDNHWAVRYNVAARSDLEQEQINTLKNDSHHMVRGELEHNLNGYHDHR